MAEQSYDFQIIANLMAGKGEAKQKLDELKKFLNKNNLTFDSLEVSRPTPISLIPQDGRTKIKRGVICLGGDGTVSETVGYILNNKVDVPLALIPTGTANLIANTLKLTMTTENFDYLLRNNIKKVDVGIVDYGNEIKYFLLGFGLGFEENFLRLTKEKLKRSMGFFSYLLSAMSELLSLKKIPVEISCPSGKKEINLCLLMVLNLHPLIMNFFPLFKEQVIKEDDGIFNVYFVEYKNYLHALLGTLSFHLLGRKNLGLVKKMSGSNFIIDSPIQVGTQIDGELRGNLPVKILLNNRKVCFFTP